MRKDGRLKTSRFRLSLTKWEMRSVGWPLAETMGLPGGLSLFGTIKRLSVRHHLKHLQQLDTFQIGVSIASNAGQLKLDRKKDQAAGAERHRFLPLPLRNSHASLKLSISDDL